MVSTRHLKFLGILGLLAPLGCGATDGEEPTGFVQSATQGEEAPDGQLDAECKKSEAYHMLIADLMHHSVQEHFSLTNLYADDDDYIRVKDNVDVSSAPMTVATLEVINSDDENGGEDDEPALAREGIAKALKKVSELPAYTVRPDNGYDCVPSVCEDVPAYSVPENVHIETDRCLVTVTEDTYDSWRATHKYFGQQCPLIKRLANLDYIDPSGDGSTNLPQSSTVSTTGVRANPYGICPAYAR